MNTLSILLALFVLLLTGGEELIKTLNHQKGHNKRVARSFKSTGTIRPEGVVTNVFLEFCDNHIEVVFFWVNNGEHTWGWNTPASFFKAHVDQHLIVPPFIHPLVITCQFKILLQ